MSEPTGTDRTGADGGISRYSVTGFTRLVRRVIEGSISTVAVEGEISNYVHHGSGHRYFTLKDSECQLRCVMFKWMAQNLDFRPAEGMQALAVGNPTVYERSGQYQLNVVKLLPLGRGDLLARLEELKKKLAAEGVFENERPLPRFPRVVGVATSPTGAAVRDIVSVIGRRAPHVRIILRPTLVQGIEAAPDIARAIDDLNDHTDADLLIVGRGGGSIEDLWCFNEETTARAIAGSRIPVISAVGHETDFTLADFAADLRAPTPSAAAELAVPDMAEIREMVSGCGARLRRLVLGKLDDLAARVASVRKGLSPDWFLQGLMVRSQAVDELGIRMRSGLAGTLADREKTLERLAGKLTALDPKGVLSRGYAIVTRESDGRIVTDPGSVSAGDGVGIEVARGTFRAEVTE